MQRLASALEQPVADGQRAGLRAGANVITVHFTPLDHRRHYLIYGDRRHIVATDYVQRQLETTGLRARQSLWFTGAATD